MDLQQVVELDNGSYQITASIDPQEALFLFGVAFSYLLKAGSVEFVTKLLGEKGSVSNLPVVSKALQ